MVSLARSVLIEARRRVCWTWSGGLSCAGSTSCAGSRSRSWCAGRGCRATRSGRRCARMQPPAFQRCRSVPSKLDPFKDEIHGLLQDDPKLPGVRVRELIEPLGFDGGKTIVDDYLREVRPLFLKLAHASADGLSAGGDLPVGSVGALAAGAGRSRPAAPRRGSWSAAWVTRVPAPGALVFSKEAPDVLWGMARCLWSLGALPELLVWDREGCLHAGGGRPTDAYAGVLRAAAGRLAISASRRIRRRRAASSGSRDTWRRTSSPAGGSRTTSTSSCSSTPGLRRPTADAQDAARPADRPADRGARGDAAAARPRARISTAAG